MKRAPPRRGHVARNALGRAGVGYKATYVSGLPEASGVRAQGALPA
jgi:hypothetical protein